NHHRLLRSLSFGDDDYPWCVAEVLDQIFSTSPGLIPDVIDHFDIDLWYQQKEPEKYQRVFGVRLAAAADFWKEGYLRLFVSHLSSNKQQVSHLKAHLADWGISAFIAHEDIEASREWRDEVEAGLQTMDVLVALVEPGFKDSDWCVQEVGYALGSNVDIIPLRAGMDPFGFFGKYQGLQVKGKLPDDVAKEIAELLLKKPKHRDKCLEGLRRSLAGMMPERKLDLIETLDDWKVVSDDQLKGLIEGASLSSFEQERLDNLISRVGAFKSTDSQPTDFGQFDDDIPF
ncbi:MAG: TIR domain-containing protein, partial [Halioglobus sp.]